MTKKNLVQVVIGGKVLTMCGTEDELQIQKVVSCVNRKLAELEPTEGYRALPMDLKPVLVELNLAEELIREQDTVEMLKADIKMLENELSEIKQKLAETQIQLEELESSAVQMTFSDVGWTQRQKSTEKVSEKAEDDSKETVSGNAENHSGEIVSELTEEKPTESSGQKSVKKSSASGRRKSGKR